MDSDDMARANEGQNKSAFGGKRGHSQEENKKLERKVGSARFRSLVFLFEFVCASTSFLNRAADSHLHSFLLGCHPSIHLAKMIEGQMADLILKMDWKH